ncbi:MAG: hypothetical protein MJ121_04910 [Clostridia bacterium]|nr:hypothetical protein [Clostridia bacterium]
MFDGLFAAIDTTGFEQFILALFQWISSFDPKAIDNNLMAEILTQFSGLWIPIAEMGNNLLEKYFGFI